MCRYNGGNYEPVPYRSKIGLDITGLIKKYLKYFKNWLLITHRNSPLIFADLIRIEMLSGTETPAGPVEEILAGHILVHMPLVSVCRVPTSVAVQQALHIHRRVRQRWALILPEENAARHRVDKGHNRGERVRALQLDVGADPAQRDRRLVDDNAATEDAARPKEHQRRIDPAPLHLELVVQLAVFAAEVADLVLVAGAEAGGRAARLVRTERVKMTAGLTARRVVGTKP